HNVVPAKAGTHTPCRCSFEKSSFIVLVYSKGRWLWVPTFAGNDVDCYTAIPSAFHSRSAWASRGDTSGYSGSSPTVGRIFQERAHLVPTAFSITTATPGTSFNRNAADGGSSLVTIAFEVMKTSARSTSNRVSKIFLSVT